MQGRKHLKAQSISEYVILFTVAVAVFSAMNIYMKRGIQAVVKDFADTISKQSDAERKFNTRETTSSYSVTNTISADNPFKEQMLGGNETVVYNLRKETNATSKTYTVGEKLDQKLGEPAVPLP